MTSSMDVWFNGNKELIWDKFCGYLHYSLPAFMHIQESLLMEQIKLLQGCELGRKLLGNQRINSVEDFRQKVPLTTYEDYEPYLSKKREDVLPTKPRTWALTTGIGGQQKWAPMSDKAWDVLADSLLSLYIMATSTEEAKFSLKPGDVMFNIAPPRPFFAGIGVRDFSPLMGLKLIPPDTDEYNCLSFFERISRGFQLSLYSGMDIMAGIGSMISSAGQSFKVPPVSTSSLFNPKLSKNILKSWVLNRINGGKLLPRHVWKLKGILAAGSDLPAFAPKIKYYWGVKPFEFYVNTECLCNIGSFAWNRKSMTFSPYAGLLEFIPQGDVKKIANGPLYDPKPKLLNEVSPGQFYEFAFTNFNGGIFTRYRTGDLIQIVSSEDEEAGIKLPQFIIKGRIDKLINIGNFTRIDEKTIWQALESSGIKYNNWLARKEIEKGYPVISLYLDCSEKQNGKALEELLHQKMKEIDSSYGSLEEIAGLKPLRVRLLPEGTMSRWENKMLKDGRDIAWIREQRIQAIDEVMEDILNFTKDQKPN